MSEPLENDPSQFVRMAHQETSVKSEQEHDEATKEEDGCSPKVSTPSIPTSQEADNLNSAESAAVSGVGAEAQNKNQYAHDVASSSDIGLRSTLQAIGSGIEELATTVKDLIGASDTESEPDLDYIVQGAETRFSFSNLRDRVRKRRQRRLDAKALANLSADSRAERDEGEDEGDPVAPCRILLETMDCNHEQYRSQPGEELYCVDVLIADDSLHEHKTWHEFEPERRPTHEEEHAARIRGIRINSPGVLKVLRRLFNATKCQFMGGPMEFKRPFQSLVSRYEDIKAQLAQMDASLRKGSEDVNDDVGHHFQGAMGDGTARSPCSETHSNEARTNMSRADFNELKCFLAFMEDRIMPDARKYRLEGSSRADKIFHEDLWHLFKPGDFVYIPRIPSYSRHNYTFYSSPSAQSIFRILRTRLTSVSSDPDTLVPPVGAKPPANWSLALYYLDYDGKSYGTLHLVLSIPVFRGKKKITELPLYPISYLEDKSIMQQAMTDGLKLVQLFDLEQGVAFYRGWTQTTNALGNLIPNQVGEISCQGPEHIESDIIVDYEETFRAVPSSIRNFYMTTVWKDFAVDTVRQGRHILTGRMSYRDCVGQGAQRIVVEFIREDATELEDMIAFMEDNGVELIKTDKTDKPTGQSLALLPRQFHAYSVLERRFLNLDIRCVRSVGLEANDNAFENLEINDQHKKLIIAMVKSHFDKLESEKKTNAEIGSQDLIRGKGKGIVILLHGVPGVGKTATAEAIAQKWKKPLFPITCGDLGFTAERLEKSLRDIFRLAHRWECVLLLDEADVFVTQRERHAIARNALVSAFLRVLEYYNGVIFLTTNRPGVLDEAVTSRVHLSLRYDHLNETQTLKIFDNNIRRLNEIEKQRNPDPRDRMVIKEYEVIKFAKEHFNRTHENHVPGSNFGKWNGRQIRNAFMIASSLAYYEYEGEKSSPEESEVKLQKQLGRSHFEIVAETTLLYDRYREDVHSGKSEDHVAAEREERATPSQPRPRTPDRLKEPNKGFR